MGLPGGARDGLPPLQPPGPRSGPARVMGRAAGCAALGGIRGYSCPVRWGIPRKLFPASSGGVASGRLLAPPGRHRLQVHLGRWGRLVFPARVESGCPARTVDGGGIGSRFRVRPGSPVAGGLPPDGGRSSHTRPSPPRPAPDGPVNSRGAVPATPGPVPGADDVGRIVGAAVPASFHPSRVSVTRSPGPGVGKFASSSAPASCPPAPCSGQCFKQRFGQWFNLCLAHPTPGLRAAFGQLQRKRPPKQPFQPRQNWRLCAEPATKR
jgi:hypothetical protein